MSDLHAQIMNLPQVNDPRDGGPYANGYRQGHRDARHAAAELALSVAPLADDGWRPMATAPKDRHVLLLVPTRYGKWAHSLALEGEYESGGFWVIFNADEAIQRVEPVGWMPLPRAHEAESRPTDAQDHRAPVIEHSEADEQKGIAAAPAGYVVRPQDHVTPDWLAGYDACRAQQPSQASEGVSLLIDKLIDAALDSDASGRPDGALADLALELRAAMVAKAPEAAPGQGEAWRDHVEDRLRSWRQRFVNKSGDQLALDDFMDKESLDDLLDFVLDEYVGPAPSPAAPVVPQWQPVLRSLAANAAALRAFEPEVRAVIGNTNWAAIAECVRQADELLAAAPSQSTQPGVCAFCSQPAEGWTQTELSLGKRWHHGVMEFHCRMAAD